MSKVKIAKTGYNADTETDERNFLFNQKSIFKIKDSGSKTVAVTYVDNGFGEALGIATGEITHSLGYVPIGFVFWANVEGAGTIGTQIPTFIPVGAGVAISLSYRLDDTKLYIDVVDSAVYGSIGDTIDFEFKYMIFYDKII